MHTASPRPPATPVGLDRYVDHLARYREIVVLKGTAGSLLVIDRVSDTASDPRLVAHLAHDEPVSNALLICHQYLSDPTARWCRALADEDLASPPSPPQPPAPASSGAETLLDGTGRAHSLEPVPGPNRALPQLRWVRRFPTGRMCGPEVVSLRSVIAAVEDYDPARSLSVHAADRVRRHRGECSAATLLAEVRRVDSSPIVLNRGLREAVLQAVEGGMSMSAIAIRCGRIKRDHRGNVSGETSWLGRRLGLLSEGGGQRPTPWVHSDVLALIARRGLGLCPREVELG